MIYNNNNNNNNNNNSSVGQTRRALLAKQAYHQWCRVRVRVPSGTSDFLLKICFNVIPISRKAKGVRASDSSSKRRRFESRQEHEKKL